MHRFQEQCLGRFAGFEPFTLAHLLPVLFFVFTTIFWIRTARGWDEKMRFRSAWLFSILLATSVIWWMFFRIMQGSFDLREDLPFHLCNILTLLFPIALYYRLRWFFGILYFWVLAGTLQAVITPDLKEPFPHFIYFRYWLVHCGLVSLIFYGIHALRWKVHLRDIKYAIIGANVYLVFSLLVNWWTGGNYFFTMRKPDAESMLDYLGPWPWYMFTGQLVMLALFALYYAPLWYWEKRRASVSSKE
ncbi:MAG TPA: TIGR02206 family membrane protein [Saprospiraceae bacterium]|nr:TIGR02206 family membrane protein [Saprospiraceae bacterium]